jgi:hypothetical protein
MKHLWIVVLVMTGVLTGRLQAQSPGTANKEKMKIFSEWVGHWKGEGSMQMGPGEPKKSTVDERIESKLDDTVLLIEGIGKATDPSTKKEIVAHHALAILSFDEKSGEYKFRSHLKDGRSTDAWLRVVEANQYQWGFDTPRGKTRYNITIDPDKKTWKETGEYSADGTTWMKFFEMTLTKVAE